NAKYFTTSIPAFLEKPQNATYTAGELAILYCSVINLGTKTVVWKRADESTPLTIGTLTYAPDDRIQVKNVPHKDQWNLIIKNVKTEDEGEYVCQISTTDRSLRQSVFLEIEEAPLYFCHSETPFDIDFCMLTGIEISGNTYVEKGDKISLICNATTQYYPPEALDWFRNGNRITTDEDGGIKISKKISLKENTITSILEIEKAQMEDDGNYVCRSSDLLITNVKLHVLNAGTSKERRAFEAYRRRTTAFEAYRRRTTAFEAYRRRTTAFEAYRRRTTAFEAYRRRTTTFEAYRRRTTAFEAYRRRICQYLI
ncbi:hypothetical protein ACJMK2_044443, partial [Sinanodonta woodiana]